MRGARDAEAAYAFCLHAAGPRSAARPPRGRVRFAVRRILGQRRPRGGAEAFPPPVRRNAAFLSPGAEAFLPPVRRNAAFLSPREMDLRADARHGFAESAATARTAGAGASIAHQAADNVWSRPPRQVRPNVVRAVARPFTGMRLNVRHCPCACPFQRAHLRFRPSSPLCAPSSPPQRPRPLRTPIPVPRLPTPLLTEFSQRFFNIFQWIS